MGKASFVGKKRNMESKQKNILPSLPKYCTMYSFMLPKARLLHIISRIMHKKKLIIESICRDDSNKVLHYYIFFFRINHKDGQMSLCEQ